LKGLKRMSDQKLVYGGYVSFPLAPKDVKNVQKLVDQYTEDADISVLLSWFATNFYGIKIENKPFTSEWRVVGYNLLPIKPEDNHAYYISGESDTLIKALIVTRYKIEGMISAGLDQWVKDVAKTEFR